jgi:predicted DNA binding CopG/RHH family protein
MDQRNYGPDFEDLGDIELDEESHERAAGAIEQAEREIAELQAVRVNFRWGRPQLALIKRAAALHGVPYQTYLKQVTMRQALTDLKDAAEAGVVSSGRASA